VRPGEAGWPDAAAWARLKAAVGGHLIVPAFPLDACLRDAGGSACKQLSQEMQNPYYIRDQAGLTQTLGWVDAWTSKPSAYAVVARSAEHVAAGVKFARENDLRLVVKGGGHAYQGTSDAPDSLLIWTRYLDQVEWHEAFVPQGCGGAPERALSLGAGCVWSDAYQAATTERGAYVQGGGCLSVGVAGLVQCGGFGSFSKHYGPAAASLLEAEVVTTDGGIRIANACSNPDLFWALRGGGGGTFGVVTRLTLRVHALPEWFGAAQFTVKASSDAAFRRLLQTFVTFYKEHLFNDHWGEQAQIGSDNMLAIKMVSWGLATAEAQAIWQPFLHWVTTAGKDYSMPGRTLIASFPARRMWDFAWLKAHWPELAFPDTNIFVGAFDSVLAHLEQPLFGFDPRPGASPNNAWWKGDGGQAGWFLWAYESVWLPQELLWPAAQARFADTLFAASRHAGFTLHFNKGMAGAPSAVLAATRATAMNPAVADAFALVISADAGGGYPGVAGHEPDAAAARRSRGAIQQSMNTLRALIPGAGAYLAESSYFEPNWQQAYWGANYRRLAAIKDKYDPDGLFFVHHGVGSEHWSPNGFTRH
ncbi:MAG: FAD-dependent oxidoreductase, partial [Terriglobales bacterium]